MAKTGPKDWTTRCETALLQEVHRWIDDEADYQSIDIYRLVPQLQELTTPRSFRRYVKQRRARSRERIEASAASLPSDLSLESLEKLTREAIGQALLTKRIPGYQLHAVLSAIQRAKVAEIRRQEEERAQEQYERKLAEAAARLAKLAESKQAGGKPRLTPAMVSEIREKVLGIVAEPAASHKVAM